MRVKNKCLWGRISPNGELVLNKGVLGDFLRMHSGKNCVVRIEIVYPAASDKQTYYYWHYAVKEVKNALSQIGELLTTEQTDAYLRTNCPLCWEDTYFNGKRKMRCREFSDLNSAEVNDFFEWMYQFASENLDLTLEDPKR